MLIKSTQNISNVSIVSFDPFLTLFNKFKTEEKK